MDCRSKISVEKQKSDKYKNYQNIKIDTEQRYYNRIKALDIMYMCVFFIKKKNSHALYNCVNFLFHYIGKQSKTLITCVFITVFYLYVSILICNM